MLIQYIKAQNNKSSKILRIQAPWKLLCLGSTVQPWGGKKMDKNIPYFSSSISFFYLKGRV